MGVREGTARSRWRLVIEGAETDPDNLLEVTRLEIASAIENGDVSGEITERVMWNDAHWDNPDPENVTPDEPTGGQS